MKKNIAKIGSSQLSRFYSVAIQQMLKKQLPLTGARKFNLMSVECCSENYSKSKLLSYVEIIKDHWLGMTQFNVNKRTCVEN